MLQETTGTEGLAGVETYESGRSGTTLGEAREKSKGNTKRSFSTMTGEGLAGVVFEPSNAPKPRTQISSKLLDRAAELLDDIEHSDVEQRSLAIESLRCVTCELWRTAAGASQYHQSLLALVEGMLLTHDDLTPSQAVALRGAVKDMGSKSLSESHLDVIRSQFVDEGYNPLALLSSMEEDDVRTDPNRET